MQCILSFSWPMACGKRMATCLQVEHFCAPSSVVMIVGSGLGAPGSSLGLAFFFFLLHSVECKNSLLFHSSPKAYPLIFPHYFLLRELRLHPLGDASP